VLSIPLPLKSSATSSVCRFRAALLSRVECVPPPLEEKSVDYRFLLFRFVLLACLVKHSALPCERDPEKGRVALKRVADDRGERDR
jgi:hypothetical protein